MAICSWMRKRCLPTPLSAQLLQAQMSGRVRSLLATAIGGFETLLQHCTKDLCGSLWIFVDLCGSLWIFVDLCGYLWIFVDIIASSLIYMLVGLKGDEKKELMLKLNNYEGEK